MSKLIKAGRKTTCSESDRRIGSIRNKEELLQEWQQPITVHFYNKKKTIKQLIVTIQVHHCCQLYS
jgi:hypothetical protein